jgi:hypothetical protein
VTRKNRIERDGNSTRKLLEEILVVAEGGGVLGETMRLEAINIGAKRSEAEMLESKFL